MGFLQGAVHFDSLDSSHGSYCSDLPADVERQGFDVSLKDTRRDSMLPSPTWTCSRFRSIIKQGTSIAQSIILGSLFYNLPENTNGLFTRAGVLFFICLWNALSVYIRRERRKTSRTLSRTRLRPRRVPFDQLEQSKLTSFSPFPFQTRND